MQKLPRCFNWVKESLLPEVAFPFLSSAFGLYMPKHSSSSGKVDPRLAFRVVDAFVVKVGQGSTAAPPHASPRLCSRQTYPRTNQRTSHPTNISAN